MKTTIATLVTALCIALASTTVSAEPLTCRKGEVCLKRTEPTTTYHQSHGCDLRYVGNTHGLIEMEERCYTPDGSLSETWGVYDRLDATKIGYGDQQYKILSVTQGYMKIDVVDSMPAMPEIRTQFE